MSYIDKVSVDGLVYNVQDTNTKVKVENVDKELKALEDVVDGVNSVVGDDDLTTDSKTLKGAINELDSAINELNEGSGGGSGDYLEKTNPSGSGSISMNRKGNTINGNNSIALGSNCQATEYSAVALGNECKANGNCAVSIGNNCEAHPSSISIGHYSKAKYNYSVSIGIENTSQNWNSCAIGGYNVSQGRSSFVTGYCNRAYGDYQTVSGKYNVEDNENKYAHIVGNGTTNGSYDIRSNAYTLDWQGNGWFAGDVKVHDGEGNEYSLLDIIQRVIALENN